MKHVLLLLSLFMISVYAAQPNDEEEDPWYAGNIISNYGVNISPNEVYLQIFLYANRINGVYDHTGHVVGDLNIHQYSFLLEWAMGLVERVDLTFDIIGLYIDNDGKTTTGLADTEVYLGFQLLRENKKTFQPDIRFLVGEVFPTGKYQHLDPAFSGGDAVGFGTFNTFFSLVVQKFYYGKHPFNWTLNFYYYLPSRVDVEGRSIYIYDPGAKGTVVPGVEFDIDLAFEYKFNKFWGCGCDFYFVEQNSSSFRNRGGVDFGRRPSMSSFSLAPSLEYTFSSKFGMLAGAWFTVLGRNTPSFVNFVYSLYWGF